LDGIYVHEDLFAMAAAYLFHLVSNHPFAMMATSVSGSRLRWCSRTSTVSALEHGTEALYASTMGVAQRELTMDNVASRLRTLADE